MAILLFYVGDPQQTCPQHGNYNAFDYLLNFRPYREYVIYYFGVYLNQHYHKQHIIISNDSKLLSPYPQDQTEPLGADVNTLMPDMDPKTIQFIHHRMIILRMQKHYYKQCLCMLLTM